MKRILALTSICFLFFNTTISAQKVNTDSLSLVSKISSDQLKLGKLQNTVEQTTKDKQDASMKAQKSADENSVAARKLSDNPEDKKLAREAKNKAGDAKSDARNARKEEGKLDDLNRDIQDLKNKIASEQVKLNKYIL
jgi:hypothetical protein